MTPRAPRVSVVVPARDAASTVVACLESVRRQSEAAFECIVVDDGSSDATAELGERIARGDSRFRAFREPHRGLVAALSTGIAHCRAEIVARMDADDVMHRDRLRLQLAELAGDRSLDAVGCHVRLFPRSRLGRGMRAYERWLNGLDSPEAISRDRFVECPVAHPALAIRTATLRRLGYRDRGWPEDYDLVLRLLAEGGRIGVVPRRLLSWRHGPQRMSRTDPRYAVARFTACKAAFLAEGFLRGRPRYTLWGYGHTGRALRRALAALGATASSIVEVHPGRIGRDLAGAPAIAPDGVDPRRHAPLVVSVAGARPRSEIRAFLAARGFTELRDFVCAA